QRERKGQRIGKDVWDVVCLKQRRHLRLACVARHALTDVEHGVPALAGCQTLGQRADMADTDGLVAKPGKGRADGGDRDLGIELGALLLAHASGEVVGAEIEGHTDAHGSEGPPLKPQYAGSTPNASRVEPAIHVLFHSAAIAVLSRPSVPSGSG